VVVVDHSVEAINVAIGVAVIAVLVVGR